MIKIKILLDLEDYFWLKIKLLWFWKILINYNLDFVSKKSDWNLLKIVIIWLFFTGESFRNYRVNGRPDTLTDSRVYSLFEYTKIYVKITLVEADSLNPRLNNLTLSENCLLLLKLLVTVYYHIEAQFQLHKCNCITIGCLVK